MKQKQVAPQSPANLALLDLGVVLGQTQAFGMIAGRCTAAQALGLKRLREEKLYKSCALTWEDFCRNHLKISKAEADRTIRLLDEFGPEYFDLAALTRISPETYRAIAPAVKDGVLHFNGEAIELKPENSRKVTAAVAELRRSIQFLGRNLRITDRIVELDKRCAAVVAEFEEIARDEALLEARMLFSSALCRARDELARVALRMASVNTGPVVVWGQLLAPADRYRYAFFQAGVIDSEASRSSCWFLRRRIPPLEPLIANKTPGGRSPES